MFDTKKIFSITLTLLFFCFAGLTYAATDTSSVDVQLNVEGCNNNLVCEPGAGEDIFTCPVDCTPEEPEDPEESATTTPGTGGGIPNIALRIKNLEVTTTSDTAVITFEATKYAIASLQWGTTGSYELGSTATPRLQKDFAFILSGLRANQAHTFLITLSNGSERFVYEGTFVTKPLSEASRLPDPVTELVSSVEDEVSVLEWQNPEQYDYIRIMRRSDTFPLSPFDGEVVHESGGEVFFDEEHLSVCGYYTVFVRLNGQYSSGVSTTTCDDVPFGQGPVGEDVTSPGQYNIWFSQQGQPVEREIDRLYLVASDPTTVHVSNNLNVFEQRAVLVIDNQESKTTLTHVLQYNEQTGTYEAYIDTGKIRGYNEYTLFILSRGEVVAVFSGILISQGGLSFGGQSFFDIQPLVIIGLILFGAFMWIFFIWIRRRKEEEEDVDSYYLK